MQKYKGICIIRHIVKKIIFAKKKYEKEGSPSIISASLQDLAV